VVSEWRAGGTAARTCDELLQDPPVKDRAIAKACALARAGFDEQAVRALREAIQQDPNRTAPADFAQEVHDSAPPVDPFAKANRFRKLGYTAEAEAALKEAIRQYPDEEVPDELKVLQGRPVDRWQARIRRCSAWLPQVPDIISLLLAALGLLLALALLVALGVPFLWRLIVWRLPIPDPLRRGLRPPLIVQSSGLRAPAPRSNEPDQQPPVPSVGEEVAMLVRQQLRAMASSSGSQQLRIADTPPEAVGLPAQLVSASPSLVLLEPARVMLQRIAPKDTLTLETQPHRRTDRGVGLTLTLIDARGELLDTETIWERMVDPLLADPQQDGPVDEVAELSGFGRLAIAAAVWTYYKLQEQRPSSAPLDVASWKSYALLRVGADWWDARDRDTRAAERARAVWVEAVSEAPDNLAARLNLAFATGDLPAQEYVERKVAEAAQKRKAHRRLLRTQRVVAGRRLFGQLTAEDAYRCDPLWYQAAYNLAAARANAYFAGPRGQSPEVAVSRDQARETTVRLVTAIERSLYDLQYRPPLLLRTAVRLCYRTRWRTEQQQEREFEQFLRRMQPAATILLAGLDAQYETAKQPVPGWPGAALPVRLGPDKDQRAVRLRHLQAGGYQPALLLEGLLKEVQALERDARYNLACYYSKAGGLAQRRGDQAAAIEAFEHAMTHLTYCHKIGYNVKWAQEDPTLDEVRNAKATRERFENLFGGRRSAARNANGAPIKVRISAALFTTLRLWKRQVTVH
jgi:tetratricopeptide (TPR) repeat protein